MSSAVFLSFFLIVVGLPVLASIYKGHVRFRERQLEVLSSDAAEKAAQYAAKTERLEQRVAVLERILTDRSIVLADQIDRLRDAPLN